MALRSLTSIFTKVAPTLTDPYKPTTAAPLDRTVIDLVADHEAKFPQLLDRGAARPYQGVPITMPDGTQGGAPLPYDGQLARLGIGELIDSATEDLNARTRKAIADDARRLNAQTITQRRPVVNLSPGIGGLDVALSLREVPDAPSGSRGIIRDLKTRAVRGRFAQDFTAPKDVLDKLRNARTAKKPPLQQAVVIAPKTDTNAPGGGPQAQPLSGAYGTNESANLVNQRINTGGATGATTEDLGAAKNTRLLMIVGLVVVAVFAFKK